jgi:acyl transferase domain-containing protein
VDASSYDAHFFDIPTSEASHLKPNTRLLLETTWQALENAAVAPSKLSGTETGVFVACGEDGFDRVRISNMGFEGECAIVASV